MEKDKPVKNQLPDNLKKDIKSMSEALSRALRFMTQIINEDTQFMEDYYKEHGDIKYRPKVGGRKGAWAWGEATEIDLMLKADTLGLSVKRLIDTVAVIEQKLGGIGSDSSPETYSVEEEKEHEDDTLSRAQKLLDEAESKSQK